MAANYKFGPFHLDAEAQVLIRDAEPVALGRRAVALLRVLVDRPGTLISKEALIEAAWSGRAVQDSNLAVQIAALRRALAEESGEHRIDTLPRRGYRFVGLVTKEESGTAAVQDKSGPALALPDKPSIAVLPFANMSGDPEEDYFAEGMAEEIITALARCGGLFVIARNSSFSYKGKAVDIRQVGRELGVCYVLEGSVRRGGDRLRFTGQLIDATNGVHIWADRFEGELHDVFNLQDRFTEAVVAAIEPKVQLAEIDRLRHRSAANLNVYDLYLRGLQLTYEFTEESFAVALRHLEQALVIDPSFATVMALAAYCHAERSTQGWAQDLEAEAERGIHLAARAVEITKDDANVFWMTAYAVLRLQLDAHRARELAHHSLRLNPNSAIALAVAGRIEHALGNSATALELLGRAQRLNPRDPRGWFVTTGLANAHFSARQFEEALAAAKAALSQNPRSAVALRVFAASLSKLGRRHQAADAVRELLRIDPQMTITKVRAQRTYIEGNWWSEFLAALRLAGLPE